MLGGGGLRRPIAARLAAVCHVQGEGEGQGQGAGRGVGGRVQGSGFSV